MRKVEADRGVSRRIAVAIPSLDAGGAERVAVNLLRGFAAAGFDVDLLLVRRRGPLLDEVPEGVRIVTLRGGRVLASVPSLVAYLRRRRPDALLSHLDTMNLVSVWARAIARVRTRVVVTTHILLSSHAARGPFGQRVAAWLVGRAYRSADAVVAVSGGVAAELERRMGDTTGIRVIHNPIVTPELRARAEALRADPPPMPSPVPPGSRLVLSVGRLTRQKNQRLLIDAFARVARDDPSLHLAILGEGPLRTDLQARVRELGLEGRVVLPGFLDPSGWYAVADLFVLSSDWEGLPTVLIEALLHGCPVVSTRCPSGPEEILDEGRFGLLVPPGDVEALAEAIRRGLAAPLEAELLRRRGGSFDFRRSVEAYLETL